MPGFIFNYIPRKFNCCKQENELIETRKYNICHFEQTRLIYSIKNINNYICLNCAVNKQLNQANNARIKHFVKCLICIKWSYYTWFKPTATNLQPVAAILVVKYIFPIITLLFSKIKIKSLKSTMNLLF